MDRSSRQKLNKETQTLNDTLDQKDLTAIYRTFHLKVGGYTFFSSAHRTFSRIDHILGHKSSPSEFKKLKSYQRSFLTTVLYETRYQLQGENGKKIQKYMEVEHYAINNQEIPEEIKKLHRTK